MKILLLVAEHGYSFVNQAQTLSKGLSKIGINNVVERIDSFYTPYQKLQVFKPEVVIGIGSWHSYQTLVKEPQKLGFRVVPWIVSDGQINQFIDEYNQLDLILTPSQHCKQIFIRDGLNEKIVRVLPEAVDPDFWHQIGETEIASLLRLISISDPKLSLPFKFDLARLRKEKVPILFTTGGDATSKGAQEVILALAKINKRIGIRKWLYLIKTWPSTGSFDHSREELELARKFGLLEQMRYIVGEFSKEFLRGLISACDIYIAPSREEGFGLPLVEAQMCGKPVISIAATSTQEIVEHEATGFLVKAKWKKGQPRAEINDLSRTIETLLINRELRSEMGKRARDHAIKKFSPEIIAKNLLNLI